MLILIVKIINLSLFNNKMMINFLEHFNDLFKKHNIFKKSLKIH